MSRGKSSHKARFEKWQQLAPVQTRFLSSMVEARLSSLLEAQGFSRVEYSLRQLDRPVSGRELEFERWEASLVDSLTFNFDKYGAPRFQVIFSRREAEQPCAFLQAGNLVASRRQYFHFWGKPWWLPAFLWSQDASLRTIVSVEHRLAQALDFLATGQRGINISPAVALTLAIPVA